MNDFEGSGLIIEAIVENIEIKHAVFKQLESIVDENCILASNTSSLSIAAIGSVLNNPSRVIGIHFFNPAPLMPLRSEEHTSELQSRPHLVCRLLLEKKKKNKIN